MLSSLPSTVMISHQRYMNIVDFNPSVPPPFGKPVGGLEVKVDFWLTFKEANYNSYKFILTLVRYYYSGYHQILTELLG